MKLSVIILNYNVSPFLELCLRSVEQAILNLDAEIIVIDNDSKDDSCQMVKTKFPKALLIENRENTGFPKGNNIGVSQAKGEYVCILNPDTVVAEDTFEKVLEFADSKSDLGALGVRLVDGKGRFLPESKRGVPTPWVAFCKVSGLYKIFPKKKTWNGYYTHEVAEDENGKTAILVGAFMLMKRKIYLELGGFDEGCFMYSDDIDLSYRLLLKGLANYYYGESTVIHFKGESTVRDAKYLRRFEQAMTFFYKKHLKGSWWFSLLMTLGIYFFYVVKKFKGANFRAIKVDRKLLISKDESLRLSLKEYGEEPIDQILHLNELPSYISNHTKDFVEIIFDNHTILFKNIIETIVNCSSKSIRYRIIPAQSSFYIGSDSSESRGEVVTIKNVSLNH